MKKKSIIKSLLYDDPCSCENVKMSEAYWKIYDVIEEIEKQFADKAKDDEELSKLIKRYADAYDDLAAVETESYFEMGVKFGVLFGMAIAEEN